METFKAEEKNIKHLFQEKISYEIPMYQRPYSWSKDEIEKFLEDIHSSYENEEEYLLSSIILVEKKKDTIYEVIDGQQRLTTISIFLSVLKLFIEKEENKKDIETRILNGQDVRIQRLKTDKSFHEDFQEILENFDIGNIQEKVQEKKFKKNNYYLNSIYIYNYLNNLKDFDFDKFYEDYFIDQVYLIRVITIEMSKAMRLFEVLNSRGLPLENSDLIKNDIMKNIYENVQEEDRIPKMESFENKWKEIEKDLNNIYENMENIFTYYIYMKLKENPKKKLFEEFKSIIKKEYEDGKKINDFLKDFYEFYEIYINLFENKKDISIYRKINSMKYLREGRFWKTILISFKRKFKESDFSLLVDLLFKFYYLNFLSGESVNPYKQLSFNIIKEINEKENFQIEELKNKFQEYYKKQKTFERIKEKLNGDTYGERWLKPVFYLIEYFNYMDKEDEEIFYLKNNKIQLEHIFPQNEINWKNVIEKDNEIVNMKNQIGNLTLLFQSNNVKCSNYDFNKKKEIYKNSMKFNHTKELLKMKNWNSCSIKERTIYLINQIEEIFKLEKNILINS